MTVKWNLLPLVLAGTALLLIPGNVLATMIWEVTDGDPYYMSDAIVVCNSPSSAVSLNVTNPVGLEWQDPIAGQTNDVWVRVWRFGPLEEWPNDTQTGRVRLFIGRAGTLFEAANYNSYDPGFNTNLLTPPDSPIWDTDGWDDNLIGSAVAPVRFQITPGNWSTEYVLDKDSTLLPPEGQVQWLLFKLESYRLPYTASSEALPFSLVAYVYDPEYDDGGDITTNLAMAERRFNVLEIDYGDAPDPAYPTLLANSGASHLATGIMLGSSRDGELDGQPSAAADGDGDDEDGVVFYGAPIPGTMASVDVTVSASGFLNAWVDFNQDGDWGDAEEQIFTDQAVAAGVNNLSFNIPAAASTAANPYTRFRVDSAGGLSFTGRADDGEVEDYLVREPEKGNGGRGGGGCNTIGPKPGDTVWPDLMAIGLLVGLLMVRRRLALG